MSFFWLLLLQLSSVLSSGYQRTEFDSWYLPITRRPVDVVADVINDLGVRILQQYVSHGNVAFSPTGVGFVLAALYEGSAGRGSKQIAEALGLPRDRDVTRIGFRDIHRRLRSYLNADGFLGGLTLSRENTLLRSEYEDILRFYGFDLKGMQPEINDTSTTPGVMTTESNQSGEEESSSGTTIAPEVPTTLAETNGGEMLSSTIDSAMSTTTQPVTTEMPVTTVESTSTSIVSSVEVLETTMQTGTAPDRLVSSTTEIMTDETSTMTTIPDFTAVTSVTTSNVTIEEETRVESTASSTIKESETDSTTMTLVPNPVTVPTTTDSITSTSPIVITVMAESSTTSATESSVVSTSSVTTNIGDSSTTPETLTTVPEQTRMAGNSPTTHASSAAIMDSRTTTVAVDTSTDSIITDSSSISTMTDSTTIPSVTNSRTESITLDSSTIRSTIDSSTAPITEDTGKDTSTVPDATDNPSEIINPLEIMNAGLTTTDSTVIAKSTIPVIMIKVTETAMTGETLENAITSDETIPRSTITSSQLLEEGATGSTTISIDPDSSLENDTSTEILSSSVTNESPVDAETTRDPVSEDFNGEPVVDSTSTGSIDTSVEGATTLTSTQEITGFTDLSDITRDKDTTRDEPTTTVLPATAIGRLRSRLRRRKPRSSQGYFYSVPAGGPWFPDYGTWKIYPSSTNEAAARDSTEISFLVNGCDVSSVSASTYIAVLPFAYFPSLRAVALEFPLDDPRYNILLLMPTGRTDTHRLAQDLGGKSLRLLRKHLQPTWVRATIPSFMLRGFVTLTPFIQRLGITDVFEPRVADLTLMTADPGVYARDVDQSIGVNIRNYMTVDRTHSRNGLFERAGPVPFTVHQPFLYFIIDAETSATLIAGRVDDPLNSRIL